MNPTQNDVLLDCGTDSLFDIFTRDICQLTHLRRGDISKRKGDRNNIKAGLALLVDVGLMPLAVAFGQRATDVHEAIRFEGRLFEAVNARHPGGPGGIEWKRLALLIYQLFELFQSKVSHQELDSRFLPIPFFAQTPVNSGDGLGHRKHLLHRQEVVEDSGLIGDCAEAATDIDLETARLAVYVTQGRYKADVVHLDESTRFVAASGKSADLRTGDFHSVRVTEQELHKSIGIGRNIEELGAADASQRACGDVTHRVAASFACGDVLYRETPHKRGGIFNMNIVQLEVLPGSDMANAIRILLRQVGQDLQASCIHAAERYLDSLHAGRVPHGHWPFGKIIARKTQRALCLTIVALAIVVSLAIDSASQARFCKDLVVYFPLFLKCDLGLEDIYLFGQRGRHFI